MVLKYDYNKELKESDSRGITIILKNLFTGYFYNLSYKSSIIINKLMLMRLCGSIMVHSINKPV